MQKVKSIALNLKDKFLSALLSFALAGIVFLFLVQITALVMIMAGKDDLLSQWETSIRLKTDGLFKNNPGNIFYNENKQVWVESVSNNVKIGKLAGSRQLEFGVKNILEEYLQEKEYNLSANAPNRLRVEIVYLDVLKTKKNISVFHSDEVEVVIRMKGTLYNGGKKVKDAIVEESSSEVSMSTLIVDEGGKFNQASLSNALKKTCNTLITKLFD